MGEVLADFEQRAAGWQPSVHRHFGGKRPYFPANDYVFKAVR